ncbi:MAG: Rieske (2Fe-2S) protein [Draconibacterium sp.]
MEARNRRIFLKIAALGIVSFFVFLWNKLTLNHLKTLEQGKNIIPFNQNKNITFYDKYIVVNESNKITVLSSQCKHLGCKINKTENGKLVCPCHGSEYDFSGNVLKGPSYKNLDKLPYKISSDGTQLEIEG